ncbi:(Fe-S)-binding protein [Desulfobacula sp.]|uniref:(Fe-S)-binding protein n=1 Tax=Desulfobacula sp. TaxID=2593537 RepID=UPI00260EDB35|nr:(Fe-S)-binding protein [Desulfobacula sp.]
MQLSKQQIDYCMECGVCTGSCPVAMDLEGFSPRQMIKRTLDEPEEDILQSKDIWACLSCSRCSDRCPVEIDFPAFIRTYRNKARQAENVPKLSHHGMFHTITSIQAKGVKQDRIAWAKQAGKISEKGEYFYFTGCITYYDVAFQYLDLHMIESAKNNLLLLNKLGIEPVISNDECCCGHDAFWCGDDDTFLTLARKNIETIAATGAKTVIFGCPEGYAMFREAYTDQLGPLPFEIVHITEFLAKELPGADISFKTGSTRTVTYQDPCRLGRRSGVYDAPRDLISLVPGTLLSEMEHNRENAVCCGTTAWMECSTCSKVMQIKRLKEAEAVGAQTIITACPKCQIHLTCATKNTNHDIDIIDLASYLADNIE